jgi:hypothetical protein
VMEDGSSTRSRKAASAMRADDTSRFALASATLVHTHAFNRVSIRNPRSATAPALSTIEFSTVPPIHRPPTGRNPNGIGMKVTPSMIVLNSTPAPKCLVELGRRASALVHENREDF